MRKKGVKVSSQIPFPETGNTSGASGFRRKVTSLFWVCGEVFEIAIRR